MRATPTIPDDEDGQTRDGEEESSEAQEAAQQAGLTATIHDEPTDSHDGSNAFTFELRFSETPAEGFSYTTIRDHAFTVTAGEVVKAKRLEAGKNVRWEISVRPGSNAKVTIELPATTDCDAQGALCTGVSRALSNRLKVTVSGPGG